MHEEHLLLGAKLQFMDPFLPITTLHLLTNLHHRIELHELVERLDITTMLIELSSFRLDSVEKSPILLIEGNRPNNRYHMLIFIF